MNNTGCQSSKKKFQSFSKQKQAQIRYIYIFPYSPFKQGGSTGAVAPQHSFDYSNLFTGALVRTV